MSYLKFFSILVFIGNSFSAKADIAQWEVEVVNDLTSESKTFKPSLSEKAFLIPQPGYNWGCFIEKEEVQRIGENIFATSFINCGNGSDQCRSPVSCIPGKIGGNTTLSTKNGKSRYTIQLSCN